MLGPLDWPTILKVLTVVLILAIVLGFFIAARIIRAFLNNDPIDGSFPQNILLLHFTYIGQTQNHLSGSFMIVRIIFSTILSCPTFCSLPCYEHWAPCSPDQFHGMLIQVLSQFLHEDSADCSESHFSNSHVRSYSGVLSCEWNL